MSRLPRHAMKFIWIVFFLLCVAAAPRVGFAQESAPPGVADNPYKDIPDAYFEEAAAFFRECTQKSRYYLYYNCACMEAHYLDKRIEFGPDAHSTSIINVLSKKCADATEASGSEYKQCLTDITAIPVGANAEDFCACYARTYADLFERYSPGTSSTIFVQIRSRALLTCKKPELAKKLYPAVPPAKKQMR